MAHCLRAGPMLDRYEQRACWSDGTSSICVSFVWNINLWYPFFVHAFQQGVPGKRYVLGSKVRMKLVQYAWTIGTIAAFVVL